MVSEVPILWTWLYFSVRMLSARMVVASLMTTVKAFCDDVKTVGDPQKGPKYSSVVGLPKTGYILNSVYLLNPNLR